MNPELPQNLREEMESRVTALLLGELSVEEAAAVREAVAKDPELAKLHDDLEATVQLVRSAATQEVESIAIEAAPPKLSEARRKKLLSAFVIPPLKSKDRKPKPVFRLGLVELAAVLAILVTLAAMLWPDAYLAKRPSAVTALPGRRSEEEFLTLGTVPSKTADAEVGQPGQQVELARVEESKSDINPANVVGYVEVNVPQVLESRLQVSGQVNPLTDDAGKDTTAAGRPEAEFSDYLKQAQRRLAVAETPPAAPPVAPAKLKAAIVLPSVAEADGDKLATGVEVNRPGTISTALRGFYDDNVDRSGVTELSADTFGFEVAKSASVSERQPGIAAAGDATHTAAQNRFYRFSGGGAGGGGVGGAASQSGAATPTTVDRVPVLGDVPTLGKAFRESETLKRDGAVLADNFAASDFAAVPDSGVATPQFWYDANTTRGEEIVSLAIVDPSTGLPSLKLREELQLGRSVAPSGNVAAETAMRGAIVAGIEAAQDKSRADSLGGVNAGQFGAFVPQAQSLADTEAVSVTPAQQPAPDAGITLLGVATPAPTTPAVAETEVSERAFMERYGIASAGEAKKGVAAQPADPARRLNESLAGGLRGSGSERGRKLVQEGRLLLEAGKTEEAEAKLKSVLEADPKNPAAQYYLAFANEARHREVNRAKERASKDAVVKLELDAAQSTAQQDPGKQLETRRLRLDPEVLRNAVQAASDADSTAIQRDDVAAVPRVFVAGGGQQGGGGGGRGGVRFLTRTNNMQEVHTRMHQLYEAAGADLSTPPNTVFFNERAGELFVRGTEQDLDTVARVNQLLAEGRSPDELKEGLAHLNRESRAAKELESSLQSGTNDVLSLYARITGKELLRAKDASIRRIPLPNQLPASKPEALRKLQWILATNSIAVVEVGDKFLKAIPMAEASQSAQKAGPADLPIPRTPSTNTPIPRPEIQTSENNLSTFSLNVSDVSFKLAMASLENGQMPDPASVRSEEFINAFDYRDPEPAAGAPIAFAWERARYPFAHNRDLLRFSLKTAAAGRPAGRPLNVVLLLDNSGSMERADRVQIIREALRVLASQLQPQDKLSVVTFARTPRLIADGVSGDKAGEVTEQVGGLTPQGGTNLEEAMNLAYATAAKHYVANGINRVVVLTDGAANLGNVEPESLKQQVETQRKQGIALDAFGIGWEGFNDDLLETLSRNGDGRYGFINSPEEAATEFAGQLAGALKVAASDVKVQVEFNPKRVTAYRQIGYAKHQLTKEQFRDNTVDAAEIAAQEAGNALYTVEVNPAGEGPLATVRVRYKIPGTTDYREQAWDVPFTGNALSLEQSSVAMRLAASASAFSEWLVASPFAGEVTPDRVLGYLSGVPEVFGADSRPKKLEWMIRQAKSIEGK